MPLPYHRYASVPVATDATTAHLRLTTDVEDRIATATADALAALGPQTTRWGLTVSALPATSARTTAPGELGAVEVTWRGDETATGWPSLTGRLVVSPQPGGRSRLLFLSHRSPLVELVTGRLDRLHRQRVVDVTIQHFLRGLAGQLGGGATDTDATGTGGSALDRRPVFVHHLQDLEAGPDDAHGWLLGGLDTLAARATAIAISEASVTLAAGRFRAAARPRVETWPAGPDEPATAWIRWDSDEEATGWPQLDLALLIEAHRGHARLAVLSPREAGYDLSLNRIDRLQRHRILQDAGSHLGAALAAELPATRCRSADRPTVPA